MTSHSHNLKQWVATSVASILIGFAPLAVAKEDIKDFEIDTREAVRVPVTEFVPVELT